MLRLLFAVIGLIFPILLGAFAGWAVVFPDPRAAASVLNRYALLFAFPALMFSAMAFGTLQIPTSLVFWALVPLALIVAVGALRLLAPRQHVGAMALVAVCGNVAYLGIPLIVRVLGEQALGLTALMAGLHIFFGLSIGLWLLLAWSDVDAEASPLARILRQPIVWAPLLGLMSRGLPASVLGVLQPLIDPVGGSAGPVALFLVGLYIHTERHSLRQLDGVAVAYAAGKLLLLPAVTAALVFIAVRGGLLSREIGQVAILLAAVPAGVTPFALATEFGVQAARVAQAFVVSTLASGLTLPVVVWLVQRL